MRKFASLALVFCMLLGTFALSSCNLDHKEDEFYSLVSETKDVLDAVAEDIYSYWYDCIYKDKYNQNISDAIDAALKVNEENIYTISKNTAKIRTLYKEVKKGKLHADAKTVMLAYNDYYTLVLEDRGSFETYSENLGLCKKEFAVAMYSFRIELD